MVFYPVKFPDFSLVFARFPKSFPWIFLSFHQDILVQKTYWFFLNVALVTLVYANITSLSTIFWQLLRFNSIKNIFLRLKGLKIIWKKSSLFWIFPWFWLKSPCFSLTGKSLQNFPWLMGTLQWNVWEFWTESNVATLIKISTFSVTPSPLPMWHFIFFSVFPWVI